MDFVAGEAPEAIARLRDDGAYETLLLPASETQEFIDNYGFVRIADLRTDTARRLVPTTDAAVRAGGPRPPAAAPVGEQRYSLYETEEPVPPLHGTDDETHLVVVAPADAADAFFVRLEAELAEFAQVLDPAYVDELGSRCWPRFVCVPCLERGRRYALYAPYPTLGDIFL